MIKIMKKGLMMLGVAAIALASCTQNEVMEVAESRAIGFEAFVGNTTKTEITKENLESFQVYGGYVKKGTETTDLTNVWENVTVSNATGEWKAAGEPKYWAPGMTYQFAAYAPAAVGTPSVNEDKKNLNWTGVIANVTAQNDFIYDIQTKTTNDPLEATPGNIKFTFAHQLAMIKVTFNSKFAAEYKLTISDLEIYGMNSTADFTGSTKAWSNFKAPIEQGSGFKTIASKDAQNTTPAKSGEFIVIPQTEGTMHVNFTATAYDKHNTEFASHKFTGTVTPNWSNGYVYNYTVEIAPEDFQGGGEGDIFVIEFDAPDVTKWNKEGAQDGGNITF